MPDLERDEAAVRIAEALWPERYVGDLSGAEWERCYAIVDREIADSPPSDITALPPKNE